MEQYICKPLISGRRFTVTVPGSKSITNRALLIAALAKGRSRLCGVLVSEDSRVFMKALKQIGFEVIEDIEHACVEIVGLGGKLPVSDAERQVYVGSAGTAARFLTAMLALSGQAYLLDSSEQMRQRPMKPLLLALEKLGAQIEYPEQPYAFPFRIKGRQEVGFKKVDLNIDESSQFLSALLLSGVMCREGVCIHLTGVRDAKAYVTISMKMMEKFGVRVQQTDRDTYQILKNQCYEAQEYRIEPDVSAACYFYAIAAITANEAKVMHVHRTTTQGDIRFLEVLERMGCRIYEEEDGIVVAGKRTGKLEGVSVRMSDFSDQTMTLAAIAPFAEGKTVIEGVGHIRRQESDRIRGIVTELRRMGIVCEEREDGLTIYPGKVKPSYVETYEDHRMAMAFSVTGCKAEGIVIANPMCCRKTFENYFEILTNLDLTTMMKRND